MTGLDPYEDLFFGWEALCTLLWNFTLSGCDYHIPTPTTGFPTSLPTIHPQEEFVFHTTFILLGIALLGCSGCTLLKCIFCQDDFESCCDCEWCEYDDEEYESSTQVDMAQEEWNAQGDEEVGEPDRILEVDGSSSLSLSIKVSEGEPPAGEPEVYLKYSPEEGELAPGEQESGVRPVYVDLEHSESTSNRILALGEITTQSVTLDYSEGD